MPSTDDILSQPRATELNSAGAGSLKPVINATGVILHTNLGRAPLGKAVTDEIAAIAAGYSNLEFDLAAAGRGKRSAHVREILTRLTGAADVLVVNNNAAGIFLALSTLAGGRDVVVSRGELIEIGGSFRIPEIMSASGARMVEVGATNSTRLADYEAAITDGTALLFKAHKSNYRIVGAGGEVAVRELADLAHARGLTMMYDIGSGLLRKPDALALPDEPDVAGAIADGADLVAFSCDKLMGGPQAGVLAGRAELIAQLTQTPLMRALRVGKLTLAALSAVCRQYLRTDDLLAGNPTFAMLSRSQAQLKLLASKLADELAARQVPARVVPSAGQCGGGTLPELRLKSVAVELLAPEELAGTESTFAERVFKRLLGADRPVLGVLREGRLLLDVLAVFDGDIPDIAAAVAAAAKSEVEP